MTGLPNVLGLPADDALDRLRSLGLEADVTGCYSKKGVEGADSVRVIRQRQRGGRAELTVSEFKCLPAGTAREHIRPTGAEAGYDS